VKLDKVFEANPSASKVRPTGVSPTQDKAESLPEETVTLSTGKEMVAYQTGFLVPTKVTVKVPVKVPEIGIQDDVPDGDDGDGPGVGGGYNPSYEQWPPSSDGLLWKTADRPKPTSRTTDEGDGPGLGGGYFNRPFQATSHGALFEEFIPPEPRLLLPPPPPAESSPASGDVAPAPGPGVSSAEGPSAFQGPTVLERMQAKFSTDPVALQRLELKAVEHFEAQFETLKTPAQFQAQTVRLKEMVRGGASLEEVRPQAYALARVVAKATLGKHPYDSQVLGALSLEKGTIAQMGTGEGKTLTALMPLYLNALSGEGSHLVTVNDYLAQAGFDELKPAFEALGMSTGLVLKDMSPEEKRAGYAADVTYLSNDTLGFDYLNDRTVSNPQDRVQREPGFALLDEADQVLLDEARVPLIIAGLQSEDELKPAMVHGQLFKEIVENLVPGEDFRIDRKAHSAFLTDIGQDIVANEVGLRELSQEDPQYAQKLAAGQELRTLLREEAKLTQGETDLPPELAAQRGLKKAWSSLLGRATSSPEQEKLDGLRERKSELLDIFPGANLYAEEQMERVGYLQNALEARGLFRLGKDYAVENGEVQIIDEFKGRISEGRRFTQGLHQALEIKEGLEPKPETHTLASITYPNLFRRYKSVAGMTGTAESAKQEFGEVLGLNVVVVPPNKESQRKDHLDGIFSTQEEKFQAVSARVQELFEEGVPVLVATRSVEMNQYVSALLDSQGIGNQSLNAQDVKTNTPEENAIIATAGQSGVITVATNMAGRGVDIKPDAINYKKLAVACDTARREGESVVVILDPEKPEQADRLITWFQLPPDEEGKVPFALAESGAKPEPGKVLLSYAPVEGASKELKAEDFPGKKLVVLATERNLDRRIDDQLRGRAGRQGAPGETQFFVSLEDDLLRIYADTDREKLGKILNQGGQDKIRALVDEAQHRVENMNADARLQTTKYDQVANRQREVVWGFRDDWVDSRPDVCKPGEAPRDVSGQVTDWIVEVYTKALEEELGGKWRPSDEKIHKALEAVGQRFDFPVQLDAGPGDWKSRLEKGLRSQLKSVEETISKHRPPDLHENMLEMYQWQTVLQNLDKGWTNQLQVLEDEKQGSNLEAYAGKEPEQVYVERSFKAFDEMWNYVKDETTKTLLQQMTEVSKILAPGPGSNG
jgi:preprotein translocase subunit SecA